MYITPSKDIKMKKHYGNTGAFVCSTYDETYGTYSYTVLQQNFGDDIQFSLDIFLNGNKITPPAGLELDLIYRIPAYKTTLPTDINIIYNPEAINTRSVDAPYYEVNVPRSKKHTMGADSSIITTQDLSYSIQVEGSTNKDYIWITYVTKIIKTTKNNLNYPVYSYALPYVIKYEYTKKLNGTLGSLELKGWGLPLADDLHYNQRSESPDFSQYINYNNTPITPFNTDPFKYGVIPFPYGITPCISSEIDTTNGILYNYVSWNIKDKNQNLKLVNEITQFDITNNSFLMPTSSHGLNLKPTDIVIKNDIKKIGNYIYTSESIASNPVKSYLNMFQSNGFSLENRKTLSGFSFVTLGNLENYLLIATLNSTIQLYKANITEDPIDCVLERIGGVVSLKNGSINDINFQTNPFPNYHFNLFLRTLGNEIKLYQLYQDLSHLKLTLSIGTLLTLNSSVKDTTLIQNTQIDNFNTDETVESQFDTDNLFRFYINNNKRINDQPITLGTVDDISVSWDDSWQNYKVKLIVANCSGIFKSNSSDNVDLVQPLGKNRTDLKFKTPIGEEGTNHWVGLDQPFNTSFSLKYLSGSNLKELVQPDSWKNSIYAFNYDTDGNFTLDVHFNMNLEDVYDSNGLSISDVGFSMENVNVIFDFQNYIGNTLASLDEDITISAPIPDVSGYWTNAEESYIKTIQSPALGYIDTGTNSFSTSIYYGNIKPIDYIPSNSHYPLTLNLGDGSVGIPYYIEYTPKYGSREHYLRMTQQRSYSLTYVKNHKFAPDPLVGLVGISLNDIDMLPYISNGTLIVTDSPASIGIEINIAHSDPGTSSDDDKWIVQDYTTIPYIYKIYYLAIPMTAKNIANYFNQSFLEIPPASADKSYPNISSDKAKDIIDNISVLGGKSDSWENSTPDKTIIAPNNSGNIEITEGGNYMLFVGVEDEFHQFSLSCVSNLDKDGDEYTFQIPFIGV